MLEEILDCKMGVGGSNTSSGKKITSSQNDANRYWNPQINIANLYGGTLAAA